MQCYCYDFVEKSVNNPCLELLYPFGNYKAPNFDLFSIFVYSPSQCYYNELFGSFILSPDEAWRLYVFLLDNQQCESCFRDGNVILESIPEHKASLGEQFKEFYSIAYFNVIKYCYSLK